MSIPLDQPINLTFATFSDAAQTVPADPSTVSIDVLDPSSVTTSYTWAGGQVVRDSTGVFHLTYTPVTPGHYAFHWKATGTVATGQDGSFDVEPKYGGVVSLTDAKRHLNIEATDASSDSELWVFLMVATDWVAAKVVDLTPTPVHMAILELVRHMWATQRRGGGRPVPGASEDLATSGPDDFLTVPRVRELLGPYLQRPEPLGSFPCAQVWPDPPRTFPPLTWAERIAWDPNR